MWFPRRAGIWVAFWLAMRALTLAEVWIFARPHPWLGDIVNYERWAFFLTGHGDRDREVGAVQLEGGGEQVD